MSDEALRRAALDALGALGDAIAREALERGVIEVVADRTTWEGTAGTMHGDGVVLRLPETLRRRVLETPSVVDALEKAVGAALGARPLRSLFELTIEIGDERSASTPYRG